MKPPTLHALRAHAVARSLVPAATAEAAVMAMRFVQLDPIRAPARAVDLILRQRVAGYRAGDLDLAYPSLPLAEDFLHVYGVMPEATRELLHPRPAAYRLRVEREFPRLGGRVLAHVTRAGETHPRDLASLGRHRTTNGWGGASAATTRILEALHFRGMLRVARRAGGVKVYALARPAAAAQSTAVRAGALLRLLLELYSPLPEPSLRELARMITESSIPPAHGARALQGILRGPDVSVAAIDGVRWVFLAGERVGSQVSARVRLLAPFDPVVWDRRRFARFWGWDYRLEAYTPPARRRFGYYALPLLWGDDVIGWANATVAAGVLGVACEVVRSPRASAVFRRELEAEVDRLRDCIGASRARVRLGGR